MEKEYILSVTAKNHTGVLLRIAGLFSRRCYNILSIVAAQSEDSETSRLIIVVKGDDKIVRQVEKQLCKLYDVETVDVLNVSENSMILELASNAKTLNSFVELLKPYGVEKILRTGAMAMTM